MLFKKILTGVLVLTMAFSTAAAGFSAEAATDYSKAAALLERTLYTGDDLGAVYHKTYTEFRVWAPNASKVQTRVYETGSDDEAGARVITTRDMLLNKKTGVWYVKIAGDLKNKYYTYMITRNTTQVETADIYAKGAGVNGNRSMVVDLASTNPEGWDEDKHISVANPTGATVWEVSVRDFSVSSTSGVSEQNRGKYLAFTESGTTVNGMEGNPSTCVDYLKELGVKYVQIMPFYDFGSIDESKDLSDQYNWGYDPKNYNVPEGSYSSDPYKGEVRIKECKEMIKALHNAGIGVIMDVVYNHTYTAEDSFFNLTVPNYYYRRNNDGAWSNGSGCGNDTASEHKMFRKYMIDSVTYWASEYHIDGFRFDLMGLHDVDTMNEIRASLDKLEGGENIIMYGEAWSLSTSAENGTNLATQNNMHLLDERIGAFDDTIRDAVKGSSFSLTDKGFIQSGGSKGDLKTGIAGQSGSTTGWAKAPTQCVNYASCHDNYTLYDKLVASVKGTDADYRVRYEDLVAMNKLSAAVVYTSQGIPFILSGEEFARSKDGEGNSYNTSNGQNELVWTNLSCYGDLVDYYKGLMKIRNAFSGFTDPTKTTAEYLNFLSDMPEGVVAYTLNNTEDGKWNTVCVVLNGGDSDQTVNISGENLPDEWVILADKDAAGLDSLGTVKDKAGVSAHSALILADKKGYDSAGIASGEGKVVVKYYDNATNEIFAAETVTGKIGESYEIEPNNTVSMNYNVTNTDGRAEGAFSEEVKFLSFYCDKYDGAYSSVTFKFVDALNDGVLTDSIVMSNREGQQYTTPEIPSIENYLLDLTNLPKNGCGKFGAENTEVVYRYNRITDDQGEVYRVNAVYMNTDGEILETQTLEGAENQEYSLDDKELEKEFEGYNLLEAPRNAKGVYAKGEINVLFVYEAEKTSNTWIFVAAGTLCILLLIGGGVFAFSTLRGKKRNRQELDIED